MENNEKNEVQGTNRTTHGRKQANIEDRRKSGDVRELHGRIIQTKREKNQQPRRQREESEGNGTNKRNHWKTKDEESSRWDMVVNLMLKKGSKE